MATGKFAPIAPVADGPGIAVAQPQGGRTLALALAAAPSMPVRLCAVAQIWNASRGTDTMGGESRSPILDCSRRAGVAATMLRCAMSDRVLAMLARAVAAGTGPSAATGDAGIGSAPYGGSSGEVLTPASQQLAAALRNGPHGPGLPDIGAPEDLALGVALGLGFGIGELPNAEADADDSVSAWGLPPLFLAGGRGSTDLPLHNYAQVETMVPPGWLRVWNALGDESAPGVLTMSEQWAEQAKYLAIASRSADETAPVARVLCHLHSVARELGPEQRAACEWLWVSLSTTERRLVLLDLWQFYCSPRPVSGGRGAATGGPAGLAAHAGAEVSAQSGAGGTEADGDGDGDDDGDGDGDGIDMDGNVPASAAAAVAELD